MGTAVVGELSNRYQRSSGRPARFLRARLPALLVVVSVAVLSLIAQAVVAPGDPDAISGQYKFQEMPIAMPPGYDSQPMADVRVVNPAYQHLRSWISAVGAAVAMSDLVGHGRADAMCLVDSRTNSVIVTYTPTAPVSDKFVPFALTPKNVPFDASTMAPMGCAPGDYNSDGAMDVLVFYWGRTPIMFTRNPGSAGLSPDSYRDSEVVADASRGSEYGGPLWNTGAVTVADFNGDAHPDLFIGNYFADSPVLDVNASSSSVSMNSNLSHATNAGGGHILRWTGSNPQTGAPEYTEDEGAIPNDMATGWTLAAATADLTGDGLPELYIANDYGKDHLLFNQSPEGRIRFTNAVGQRTPTTPKSFVLGNDSFKGMGVDFLDIYYRGCYDIIVSNITQSFGLEESNFLWRNNAGDGSAMKADLARGFAPFTQQAQQMGLAWSGWAWDVKGADLLNRGSVDIIQSNGFLKGNSSLNRWPWLQEFATGNDAVVSDPSLWPNFRPGDSLAGDNTLGLYARLPDGNYTNISDHLGVAVPIPTRGIATGDTTGTGVLDFAVARQWGPPAFYRNVSPALGHAAEFGLTLAPTGAPAYGAEVRITTPDGKVQLSQLDGGSGHGGKRSFDVHFGIGDFTTARAEISWRGLDGVRHNKTLEVSAGVHSIVLDGDSVRETVR